MESNLIEQRAARRKNGVVQDMFGEEGKHG